MKCAQSIVLLCLLITGLVYLLALDSFQRSAYAAAVSIQDNAHVLNVNQVRDEAAKLPDGAAIYTMNTFTGDEQALYRKAQTDGASTDQDIVEIDTVHRNAVFYGDTNEDYQTALRIFQQHMQGKGNDGYTDALIAALQSLQKMLNVGESGPNWYMAVVGLLCFGPLVILAFGMVIFLAKRAGDAGGSSDHTGGWDSSSGAIDHGSSASESGGGHGAGGHF